MNMIDSILRGLQYVINGISNGFNTVLRFFAKMVNYIIAFFEDLFLVIYLLFQLVIKVVTIFVKLGQYFFSLVTGFLNNIFSWLTFRGFEGYDIPYSARDGVSFLLEQVGKFGVMTTIPVIVTCFVWFFTVYKLIGLLGDTPPGGGNP